MTTATKKPKPLSWKAKRKGEVYCAPACGSKCTWAAYQLAKRRARALAKHMGKGWKIRVHENMGWHYNVLSPCGRISVSEYWPYKRENPSAVERLAWLVPDHYTAFMNTPDRLPAGRWTGGGSTPEEAIREAVEVGMDKLALVRSIIEGLEHWAT